MNRLPKKMVDKIQVALDSYGWKWDREDYSQLTRILQKAGLLQELSAQDKKDLELGRAVRVMRDRGNLIHWKTGSWWYGDAYQIPGHPFATPEAALAAGRKSPYRGEKGRRR